MSQRASQHDQEQRTDGRGHDADTHAQQEHGPGLALVSGRIVLGYEPHETELEAEGRQYSDPEDDSPPEHEHAKRIRAEQARKDGLSKEAEQKTEHLAREGEAGLLAHRGQVLLLFALDGSRQVVNRHVLSTWGGRARHPAVLHNVHSPREPKPASPAPTTRWPPRGAAWRPAGREIPAGMHARRATGAVPPGRPLPCSTHRPGRAPS